MITVVATVIISGARARPKFLENYCVEGNTA